MKLWIDAQFSPKLADWLSRNYAVEATHIAALGSLRASDREIFEGARDARSVIVTKDRDVEGERHEAATARPVALGGEMD